LSQFDFDSLLFDLMHVLAGGPQIATPTAIDRQGLVAAALKVAEDFVPPIESDGVKWTPEFGQ